jgi:tetratricopeptide (TPR) repeat protein
MTKKVLFVCLIVTLMFAGSVMAKDSKVIYSRGDVFFSTPETTEWNRVQPFQTLKEGTCIKIGNDGEAAILLKDNSQIRLRAGSLFCIKKEGGKKADRGEKRGLYMLKNGSLWFRNKRRGPKPIFETPVVTASIRGTELVMSVDSNGNTEMTALEGKIKCLCANNENIIGRGQMLKAERGKKPVIVTLLRPENAAQWLLVTPEIKGPADQNLDSTGQAAVIMAEEAMQMLIQNRHNEAMKRIKKAIKISGLPGAVHTAYATILQSEGKFEQALQEAETALKNDPESVPALLRNVELLMGLDRTEEAEQLVANFKGNRDNASIYLLEGYINLVHLEPEKAMQHFKQAISLEPNLASAYLGQGLAMYNMGMTQEGLESMEKACLLDPFAAYPHNYLGKAIYEIGEREEAEIELKRAIELDSNDPTPYIYLATIRTDQYRPGEGIMALQKAIKLNDNRLQTRSRFLLDQDRAATNINLAWSLADMGLHEWARSRGDSAVWDDPSNSGAYLFRASESTGLRLVDAATLGDMKRARILQPVNENTFITYTNYQNLLEQPDINGGIGASGGTDSTFSTRAFLNGGTKRIAASIDGGYATTDGPEDGSGLWGENGLARVKWAINRNNELLFEGLAGHRHEEDLSVWQNGDAKPGDYSDRGDYWSFYTGYHWRQGAGNHLLVSLQTNGSDARGYEAENGLLESIIGPGGFIPWTSSMDICSISPLMFLL